jgi:hypothetical protein
MDKYAGLINHGDIERTPVLKEGHIHKLIINGEVVVLGRFGGFARRGAYSADIDLF